MKQRMTTTKILIVLSIVVIVSLGLYAYAFFSVRSIASEASELAAELSYQNDRNNRLSSVEILVRDTKEERAALEQHFISEDDIVPFITDVESFGSSVGLVVDVVSVTKRDPEDIGQSGELELTINFDGSWNQVTQLLLLLEVHKFANKLTNVRLSHIDTSGTDGEKIIMWSASATLVSTMFNFGE